MGPIDVKVGDKVRRNNVDEGSTDVQFDFIQGETFVITEVQTNCVVVEGLTEKRGTMSIPLRKLTEKYFTKL
jgi:hypothetical protein